VPHTGDVDETHAAILPARATGFRTRTQTRTTGALGMPLNSQAVTVV
jgi:hypothetical protein